MAQGDQSKVGVDSAVAVRQEATYGTFALTTTSLHPLQVISVGLETHFETKKLDQLARSRGFSTQVQMDKICGGPLEMYFHPEESTRLLANAMGGNYSFTSITSAGDHSITAGNFSSTDTITSLSIYVRKGDTHAWRYAGCVINSMKLSASINEPLKMSCEIVAQDSSLSASDNIVSSFSYSSALPFIYADGTYQYDATEGSLTSSVAQPIQSFELEVNNNLVTDSKARQLGSRLLSRIPPSTRREIKLKVSQRFDTTTSHTTMLQNTSGSVKLDFNGASISAEYSRRLQIVLPSVRINKSDPIVEGANEVLSAEMEYDILVSGDPGTTTSREIGITLRNALTAKI